jgi:hypothetical protein
LKRQFDCWVGRMGTKRDLEAIEARRIAGARMLKRKTAQA